jgi:tRNA(fMet)-specific endonuclease VapC
LNGSVIDTNVIIKMLNNDEAAIRLLNGIAQAFVPVVVAGELFYGAYKSSRQEENMRLFCDVLAHFDILAVSEKTAHSYALIKSDLSKAGISIPENDLWIAATAHAHTLSVATFDAHFKHIAAIDVVSP